MDHARKLLLVEPRMLNRIRTRDDEYKELLKQPDKKVKASISGQMRSALDENELPDDIKAKMYQQMLSRFMNVKDKVPELPKLRRPITSTVQAVEREETVVEPTVRASPLARTRSSWKKKAEEVSQLLAVKDKQKRNQENVKLQRVALKFMDNPTQQAKFRDYLKGWWKEGEEETDEEEEDDSFVDAPQPSTSTKTGKGFRWIKY
jgi:hypothetical protein